MQPGGREDVGAALLFEEEGEPEGEVGSVWWAEGRGFALWLFGAWLVLFFFWEDGGCLGRMTKSGKNLRLTGRCFLGAVGGRQ